MPADEIWLRDSDIVVVPKSSLQRADEIIDMVFTRGIYGVLPMNFNYQFGQGGGTSVIGP
jgi:polysaccharide export outer membrane protein